MFGELVRSIGHNALNPETFRRWLRESIEAVIDVARFNEQVDLEKRDSAAIAARKKVAIGRLATLMTGNGD